MHGFDVEQLIYKFRYPILILLVGFILVGGGFFFFKSGLSSNGTKVEVLGSGDTNSGNSITVEIAGEVINPGVYTMANGDRVDDLLIVAGGFSAEADRAWCGKYLNRAAKLIDGQKVFIPGTDKQSGTLSARNQTVDQSASSSKIPDSIKIININTASLDELDSLPGIGRTYGQNIIDHRPYSNVSELVSRGAIKQSLYEKIKDLVTIY